MRLTGIPIFAALALAGCAVTGPAPAPTDFEAMSAASRESHCLGWIWIGNNVARARGEMSQKELDESFIDLAHEILDKGDNHNYGADVRRFEAAVDAIAASEPDEAEAQAAIGYCREYLRL